MGMFDSLYDAKGREWQTKAYGRTLARYAIGQPIGQIASDYQVEVLGEADAFATIRDGRLAEIPAARDESLPLMDYGGFLHALKED